MTWPVTTEGGVAEQPEQGAEQVFGSPKPPLWGVGDDRVAARRQSENLSRPGSAGSGLVGEEESRSEGVDAYAGLRRNARRAIG